jgi:hypothetical protein
MNSFVVRYISIFMSRFLTFLTIIFLSTVPHMVGAADFVTCGKEGQEPCQTCHAVQLVNNVIEWLILILGTIAAIIIVYAGFQLVTSGGNTGAKEKAKELITNMFIGYAIVLAGWLLIDTGMKMLLTDGSAGLGVWNQVQCTAQPEAKDTEDFNVGTFNPYVPAYVGEYANRTECTALPNGEHNCAPQRTACQTRGGVPSEDRTSRPPRVVCTFPPGGSGGSSGSGSYAGSCQVLTSGPCSVQNLRPIFGAQAENASRICNKESGGNAIESRSDICCGPNKNCNGAPSFSGGYFQINILAHADMIPGCNLSSFFTKNGSTAQGNCVRRNANGICTGWSCSIVRNSAYNACMQAARSATINLRVTKQLYDARGFDPWRNSKNLCNVP